MLGTAKRVAGGALRAPALQKAAVGHTTAELGAATLHDRRNKIMAHHSDLEDHTLEIAIVQNADSPRVAVEIKDDAIHVHVKKNGLQRGVSESARTRSPGLLRRHKQWPVSLDGGAIQTSPSEFQITRWDDPIV
jgi:hypothetical protein